jgi:hypothetical protein
MVGLTRPSSTSFCDSSKALEPNFLKLSDKLPPDTTSTIEDLPLSESVPFTIGGQTYTVPALTLAVAEQFNLVNEQFIKACEPALQIIAGVSGKSVEDLRKECLLKEAVALLPAYGKLLEISGIDMRVQQPAPPPPPPTEEVPQNFGG